MLTSIILLSITIIFILYTLNKEYNLSAIIGNKGKQMIENNKIDYVDRYNKLLSIIQHKLNYVNERDRRTIQDQLYPMYNRPETSIYTDIINNPNMINIRTRDSSDTFRPIAYAKNTDTQETYFMMGREKHKGSTQCECYLVNTNKIKGEKIPLLDMNSNNLIKDIYNIPKTFTLQSNVFGSGEYVTEEIKNAPLESIYY